MVCGTRHDAHDFCVTHLEVAGAIGCGLRANLRVAPAQLVPASAVDAEEGEGVGGSVEGHNVSCRRLGLAIKSQLVSNRVDSESRKLGRSCVLVGVLLRRNSVLK